MSGLSAWAGVVGATFGALGVALGAFGAHGLKAVLEARESKHIWELASTYHLLHAVALVVVGVVAAHKGGGTSLNVATGAFALGIVFFSGSLYGLAVGGPRFLGPVTPLGGTAFIVGWVALALALRP